MLVTVQLNEVPKRKENNIFTLHSLVPKPEPCRPAHFKWIRHGVKRLKTLMER